MVRHLPLLLFAVVIGVVVWAVIRLTRHGVTPTLAGAGVSGQAIGDEGPATTAVPERPDAALEELPLRYARGEMTREDYAERLADLTDGAAAREPSAGSVDAPPTDGP